MTTDNAQATDSIAQKRSITPTEMQSLDAEELDALEQNEKTTEVNDVLNILNDLSEKLETNQEKKEEAVIEYKEKVKEEKRMKKINKVIDTAMTKKGNPYLWGGTGPYRFDCSGLMQYSFGKHGYSLPRVAADQARTGKRLSIKEIQRGDMIFFKTDKKQPWRVSHVGVYLGNGEFLHAPRTGDVIKVSPLSGKYKATFCWGVRVIH